MRVEACQRPQFNSTELDFRPEFLSSHYQSLLRDGRSADESKEIISQIAHRDLTYTFLERYSKERLVHFSYSFEDGKMLSPKYEALGDVCDRYKAAVDLKDSEGKDSGREKAELEGIEKVKSELANSKEPKSFLIISPPPPTSNYSFYYFGVYEPEAGQVDMYAWRNEKDIKKQTVESTHLQDEKIVKLRPEPNDFLRQPIFKDGGDLETFRDAISDLPSTEAFEKAKGEDFSKYSDGIYTHASMLSSLVANNADIETLRAAQLRIEMDFTKWVNGEEVVASDVKPVHFEQLNHADFRNEVMKDFGPFVMQYKTEQFSCGTCGVSIFSQYGKDSVSGLMQTSMPELFAGYIPCPGCGESVRVGSQKCSSCGMTKKQYDSGQLAKAA